MPLPEIRDKDSVVREPPAMDDAPGERARLPKSQGFFEDPGGVDHAAFGTELHRHEANGAPHATCARGVDCEIVDLLLGSLGPRSRGSIRLTERRYWHVYPAPPDCTSSEPSDWTWSRRSSSPFRL